MWYCSKSKMHNYFIYEIYAIVLGYLKTLKDYPILPYRLFTRLPQPFAMILPQFRIFSSIPPFLIQTEEASITALSLAIILGDSKDCKFNISSFPQKLHPYLYTYRIGRVDLWMTKFSLSLTRICKWGNRMCIYCGKEIDSDECIEKLLVSGCPHEKVVENTDSHRSGQFRWDEFCREVAFHLNLWRFSCHCLPSPCRYQIYVLPSSCCIAIISDIFTS